MSTSDPWGEFPRDPRSAATAHLRAADSDRDIVHRVLADAYADGRLDRLELDERQNLLTAAKTLGELPPLVSDLVSATSVVSTGSTTDRDRPELVVQATGHYRSELRQSLWGLISASLICWTIWFATGSGFPWPLFVMLGTGLNAGRVAFQRREIIDSEVRRLERKQLKRDLKQTRELPPPDAGANPE